MPKFELEKVALVDPTSLADTVVLSTMLEGADAATRSFVEEEPNTYVTEDDQEIKDGQIYTFTMAGVKGSSADETQLETWASAGTKLTISGYAYNTFLQIDNAYITFRTDTSDRSVWVITAQKAGKLGYDDNGKLDTEFMMSKNGLNMFYWQEGATSGLAAGWEKSGGSTTWSTGEQTFTTAGTTTITLKREIYFPFSGVEVTVFADIDAITTNDAISFQVINNDSSNTLLEIDSSVNPSVGLASASVVTGADSSYLTIQMQIGQDDSITFSNPGLSIGTSTDYISQ